MTGQFLRTTALCGTITLACVGGPALAQSADEVTALRAQLAALSARLEALEGQQAQTAATVSSNTAAVSTIADNPPNFVIDDKGVSEQVVVAGETPRSFKIPGTNTDFRITGFAKADFIYDFDQDVGDFFVTDNIETDPNVDTSDGFTFHARQSRLSFQTRTPSSLGDVRTLVEADFVGSFSFGEAFSNSANFRLRHAAADIGPVKVGQFWSLFTPLEAYPSTVDFQGPAGIPFTRQAQVRYTSKVSENLTLAASIENPETIGQLSDGSGTFDTSTSLAALGNVSFDQLPDFHVAGTHTSDLGTFKLAGVVRSLSSESSDDEDFGFGINASARMTPWEGGLLQLTGTYGDGVGRYLINGFGLGAVQDTATDELESVEAYGVTAAVGQKFGENWDAQLAYGRFEVIDDLTAVSGDLLESTQSVHATIRYKPLSNVTTGLELIYGCLLYTSPSPRDQRGSRMPSSA